MKGSVHEMAEQGPIVFCTGGGCTAKLGAGVLSRILEKLPRGEKDPDLLVGYDSRDDAAVYRITEDIALVQTVDFFPPMVDDPYTFGQIAAANALSDVYAMGGEVKTALNLVCFPESMDLNVLGEILRGGAEKVAAGLAEYYRDAATIKVHALNEPLPENGLYSNAMAGTDRMELYSTVNAAGDQMMLVSLFDNLGKGSSGAAVQCMNLMLGLEETKGLE